MIKEKLLFVCMCGRDRSPCASEIVNKDFSNLFEAKFAGISPIADVPMTKQALEWADKVVCMERFHRDMLSDNFPEARRMKEVLVWNVSNEFCRNDPELEKELRGKILGLGGWTGKGKK